MDEAERRKQRRDLATYRRRAERDCGAAPNDHHRRFIACVGASTVTPVVGDDDDRDGDDSIEYFVCGHQARAHVGPADGIENSAPDDDAADHTIDYSSHEHLLY